MQLTTTHEVSATLPPTISTESPAPSANKILAFIEDAEGAYQTSLADSYQEMSEKTYKGLRRALPMTRSKMDWDKVHFQSFVSNLILNYARYWDTNWVQSCLLRAIKEGLVHRNCVYQLNNYRSKSNIMNKLKR